jgi:hypothetical protein
VRSGSPSSTRFSLKRTSLKFGCTRDMYSKFMTLLMSFRVLGVWGVLGFMCGCLLRGLASDWIRLSNHLLVLPWERTSESTGGTTNKGYLLFFSVFFHESSLLRPQRKHTTPHTNLGHLHAGMPGLESGTSSPRSTPFKSKVLMHFTQLLNCLCHSPSSPRSTPFKSKVLIHFTQLLNCLCHRKIGKENLPRHRGGYYRYA